MSKNSLNYQVTYVDNIESPLGEMIAGATADGVCFLEWHDRGGIETILKRIEKRYLCVPKLAEQSAPNRHIEQLRTELVEYFDGSRSEFNVSIDVYGTPFQRKVWQELLNIPYGQTRSYGQQAKNMGKPEAVRAVASANGNNYLSILIPCHRVIGANGSLTGYGGKLWRKKRLLELEGGLTQEMFAA